MRLNQGVGYGIYTESLRHTDTAAAEYNYYLNTRP